jgi:plasmid maintenance system antidote protein VapI
MKPHPLLDAVKRHLKIRFDKELARQLEFSADYISDLRAGRYNITAEVEIAILEATNWGLWEMRAKMKGAG